MAQVPPPNYVNYPRSTNSGPNQRPPGIYFEVLGEAWKMMSRNLGLWVGCTAVVGLISMAAFVPYYILVFAMSFNSAISGQEPSISEILVEQLISSVLGFIPSSIVLVGYTSLAHLALVELRGEEPTFSEFIGGYRRFIPVALCSILVSLGTSLGYVLLIVPGIFLTGAWAFATLIASEQNVGPIEAIRQSYRALRKDAWMMFLMYFVLSAVASLGFMCCGVGALFAVPICAITMAIHYRYYFFPVQSPFETASPTGNSERGF